MENNKITMEEAQQLFEQQEYGKCIEMLTALTEAGQSSPELLLLYARLGMRIFSVTDKDNREKIFSACSDAAATATTLEELSRIENVLMEECDQNVLREHYARLSKVPDDLKGASPEFPNWIHYIHLPQESAGARVLLSMYMHKGIKPLLEKEGINLDEYHEQYLTKRPDVHEKMKEDVYKLGVATYEDARSVLEETSGANTTYLDTLTRKYLKLVVLGGCLVQYAISSDESDDDETTVEKLKAYVEYETESLNAVIYINGQPYSPVNRDRSEDVQRLRNYHKRIAKFDPNYTPPALPSAEPLTIQSTATQSSTTNSSGGCYVATAVYGSYDCPEVWTLRRYRDYTLAETWYGRAFIHTYYAISPTLVKWFGETDWFKNLWKPKLDRMVHELKASGVADTPYQDRIW